MSDSISNREREKQLREMGYPPAAIRDIIKRGKTLEHLDLSGTAVSDLSPLAGMKGLERLYLGKTGVSDLSPFAGMKSLEHLDLSCCKNLADLSPLKGMKSLYNLDLSGCKDVTDLSPLKGMKSLYALKLDGTKFEGVSLEDVVAGKVPPIAQEAAADLDNEVLDEQCGAAENKPQGKGKAAKATAPEKAQNETHGQSR